MRKELGNDTQLWKWQEGNSFINKAGLAITVKEENYDPVTKVKKNNQIGTVASWGPTFRVAVDIIVHSAGSEWSSIFRFTSTPDSDRVMGRRIPAIFYNSKGFLHITSGVDNDANYAVNYNIDLKKWYHIEIAQTKMNGKIYYTIKINGEEIKNVENTNPQSFKDVKVFAGDKFYSACDASYKNLIWKIGSDRIWSGTELCGWDHHGGPNQQFRLEGQHLVCNLNGAELVLDIQDQRAHPEEPDV